MYLNSQVLPKTSPSKLATIKPKDRHCLPASSSFLNGDGAAKEILKEPERWHNHKRSSTAPDLPVTKTVKSPTRQSPIRRTSKTSQKKYKKLQSEANMAQISSLLETNFNELNELERVKRIKVLAEKVVRVRIKCERVTKC